VPSDLEKFHRVPNLFHTRTQRSQGWRELEQRATAWRDRGRGVSKALLHADPQRHHGSPELDCGHGLQLQADLRVLHQVAAGRGHCRVAFRPALPQPAYLLLCQWQGAVAGPSTAAQLHLSQGDPIGEFIDVHW